MNNNNYKIAVVVALGALLLSITAVIFAWITG